MAFFGLLFYTICIYIRPQEWLRAVYGMPIMEIIATITIVLWISSILGSKKKLVAAPQNIFIILLLFVTAGSQLTNFYFHGVLNAFIDFGKSVIVYFLIINLVDSKRKLKIFVWLIILLTLILAMQGIFQYYAGVGIAGQTTLQGRIRSISIFGDPNDLALTLVIMVPILLMYLFNKYPIPSKVVSMLFLAVILYSIWLTNSRGGMLSLAAVIFFYFLKRFKNVWGILIAIVLVVLLFKVAPSRMKELSIYESSAHGRIVGMATGFWLLKHNLIFGAGKGAFSNIYGYTAHSSIMLVAGETGLLGLFFWLGLIYLSIKSLIIIEKKINSRNSNTQLKSFAGAFRISFIGFLVSSFFLSRAYDILLYILVAISVSIINIYKKELQFIPSTFSIFDIRNIFLTEIGSLALIYGLVKVFF